MNELADFVTPPRYLTVAGVLLILMGCAGLTGVLGRLSSKGFFHPPPWINAVHTGFGGLLLVVAFAPYRSVQTGMVLCGAVIGLTLGTAGLLFGARAARRFDKPELADMSEHVAHFVVGVLAFWAWHNRGIL